MKPMEQMEQAIKHLMFLVDEYHLNFKKQDFKGKPFGNYNTMVYSFYNDTGCFNIEYLYTREEFSFYYSSKFSNDYDELLDKMVNIWIDEPEIWNKHRKWFWFLNDPFFDEKKEKVIMALAEIIRARIDKTGEFFGIKVK